MKKIFLLVLLCMSSIITSFAQTADTIKQEPNLPPPPPDVIAESDINTDNIVFTLVEQEAQFPGGNKGWVDFLTDKLGSFNPGNNGAPKGKHTVMVQFVVSKTGQLSDIKTLTNHGFGMEAAVIKMIKKSPDWIAARQNGRTVNAYRRQPVTFVVE